jgi:uncharacterized membrane protein
MPIFTGTETLLPFIIIIVAVALWVQKFKFFKRLGPAMFCVVSGIIFGNLRIVPSSSDTYGTLMTYCVPLATSLYLLNMDMSQLRKMSRQPWIAMASAVFCVSVVSVVFGLVFAPRIFEGWKLAGMFVGTFTGGSANLTAIAVGLESSENTIAMANAGDYVVGIPSLILLFLVPAFYASSRWFQRKWPYRFPQEEYNDGSSGELLGEEKWGIVDIAILLALALGIVVVAVVISMLIFPETFISPGRILMISTLSLLAAQLKPVKKLRGNFQLGLFFSLIFLVIVGFMVDIHAFFDSALTITLYCSCIIIFSIVLHFILLRLFKIKYEYMVLSMTGAIAEGTTAALLAAGAGWKNLAGIGLLMGLVGAMVGNYVGIGIAYVVKALIGA